MYSQISFNHTDMAVEADVDGKSLKYIYEHVVHGTDDSDFNFAWEWVKKHPQLQCWIDGRYVEIKAHATCSHNNPESVEKIKCDIPEVEAEPFTAGAIVSAKEAQAKWINIHIDLRQELIFELSKVLITKNRLLSQLSNLNGDGFETILEYFNFAADLSIDKWESVGTVLIKLDSDIPPWVVAMHVASALAAGCAVILNPSPKACYFSFLLAEMSVEAGLPKGLVNVVPGRKKTYLEFLKGDVQKVIYNGYLDMDDFLTYKLPPHLSVLTPNHTACVIFETCDVEAALDKFFNETWKSVGKTIWGIDTLVVQESISNDFLNALGQRIRNCGINFSENIPIKQALIDTKKRGMKVMHAPDDAEQLVPIVISPRQVDFKYLPIVTMMAFRTVEEAAAMINCGPYCVGVSVWTEDCSQALQLSSYLETSMVWVNNHGVLDATITFEPSRKAGVGCFGGLEGALEYRAPRPPSIVNIPDTEGPDHPLEAKDLSDLITASVASFQVWKIDRNRKIYLKDIVESMSGRNLVNYTADLNVWANMGNSYELLKTCRRPEMHALQNKRPIGLIVMALMDSRDVRECFTSFVSPAIAFGNVLIVVMSPESARLLKPLVDHFMDNLPDGIVTVLEGVGYAPLLATNPNISAIAVCTDHQEQLPEVQEFKNIAAINFKRFWVQPSIERNMTEYPRRFLKEQTIFFPKATESNRNR